MSDKIVPSTPGARDYRDAFALLAEMTRCFAESPEVEATVGRALDSIAAHVGSEAGSLWLVEGDELVCRASNGPHPITGLRLAVHEGIVGRTVRENTMQRVLDVATSPDFAQAVDAKSGLVTRSILCAPMSFSDEVIGAVQLINKCSGDGRFVEHDADLLQVLASSAGLAIANARLAVARVENERVRRELELAAEIQRSLLPTPGRGSLPAYGVNVPARTVSGDFFDVLPLSGGRLAFCLGDVSGKGMNAALLMAKAASVYRCLAKDVSRPGQLLARLNDEICETATRGMFITMVAGVYDQHRGGVCLANAGHEPPLVRAPGGDLRSIPAAVPPLGIVPGGAFPETEVALAGGALYVFSDGLTEAAGADGQLGSAGIARLIERFAGRPLRERIDAVVAAVGECELRDDMTILGLSDEGRAP